MKDLTTSGLTAAATCFLRAVESLEQISVINIIAQPQHGRPVPGDKHFKRALELYVQAAEKFRAAGLRHAESLEGAWDLSKEAQSLSARAERAYKKGYKASTGG